MRDSDWVMALAQLLAGAAWGWAYMSLRRRSAELDLRSKVLDARDSSLYGLAHALEVRSAALDEREHRLIIREALLTRPSDETIARN